MSILKKVFPKSEEQEKGGADSGKDNKKIIDSNDKNALDKDGVISKFKDVLIRPIVTEKALNSGRQDKYFFEVNGNVNKIEIKNAIKGMYGVMPSDINIINKKGKKTGLARKVHGKRKDSKRAIISLKQGEKIDLHQTNSKK